MNIYVGIDIGKFELEIYCNNESFQILNNQSGVKKLLSILNKLVNKYSAIPLIVCEATGGYERLLIKQMRANNYPVHVAHPNKIRAFAKSKGLLAKTDKIDASLIADYACVMKITADDYLLSENTEKIGELLKRRDQLLADKHREQARLDKEYGNDTNRSIQSHVKWLEKEIIRIEKLLEEESRQEALQSQLALLTSVPSIGRLTALGLLAFLPEIGRTNHEQLVALVGLAPFNRDSGRYKGKRYIQGGRGIIRKALYMAAISSLRWNKPLANFYQRLRSRGKPAKVAITAVMRKLLLVLNSLMKRQSPWQENICQHA